MRKAGSLQVESSTEGLEFSASPDSSAVVRDIQDLLDRIPWEPGERIRVSKLARAWDRSIESLHRGRLHGNVFHRPDGTRGRAYLVMTKLLGEFFVSRAALESYLRLLNGLDAPNRTSSLVPVRRSAAQRRRDSETASRLAEAMGA